MSTPKMLNLTEVATILDIHPSTAYQYAVAGTIPAFKAGNNWRVDPRLLDRWIEEQSSQERRGLFGEVADATVG